VYKLLQTYFIDETENLQITLSLSRRERIGKWKGMGGGGGGILPFISYIGMFISSVGLNGLECCTDFFRLVIGTKKS